MAKIIRTEPGAILSKAVEYHGFVYLPGITSRDTKQGHQGPDRRRPGADRRDAGASRHRQDPAAAGDHLGEEHQGPGAMNEVWTPWLPKEGAPARACVQAEMAAPAVLVEIMVTACK